MKLLKIVPDFIDPNVLDGSNNKYHTELIYKGDEPGLRKKLVELNIITLFVSKKTNFHIIKHFAEINGFIIQNMVN